MQNEFMKYTILCMKVYDVCKTNRVDDINIIKIISFITYIYVHSFIHSFIHYYNLLITFTHICSIIHFILLLHSNRLHLFKLINSNPSIHSNHSIYYFHTFIYSFQLFHWFQSFHSFHLLIYSFIHLFIHSFIHSIFITVLVSTFVRSTLPILLTVSVPLGPFEYPRVR